MFGGALDRKFIMDLGGKRKTQNTDSMVPALCTSFGLCFFFFIFFLWSGAGNKRKKMGGTLLMYVLISGTCPRS